jgi:hypothetical protein
MEENDMFYCLQCKKHYLQRRDNGICRLRVSSSKRTWKRFIVFTSHDMVRADDNGEILGAELVRKTRDDDSKRKIIDRSIGDEE